jgi:hypothetical protein
LFSLLWIIIVDCCCLTRERFHFGLLFWKADVKQRIEQQQRRNPFW